ncbi:MAG TPA: TolC family protein [Kofleriaceae bacterium]|nr:TolC family protein [Kofleriaceae bacterium]
MAVSLAQAVAAVARAPAAQVGGHDLAAAEAMAEAASAWPSPALRIGTSRLTARLVAGVTLPLPVFGTVGAARRVADAEARGVRADAGLALRDLRYRVIVAWIDLVRTHADLGAQQVAAQQAAELELIARGRRAAGTAADVDVTVAGAARARATVAVAAAARAEQAASAELAGLLGWDPGRALRADGALVTGPGGELAGLRRRLAGHPEHAAAQQHVAVAEAGVDAAAVQRWPVIAVEGELDYDDDTIAGATPWARSDARVGVAIELPIFAHVGDRIRAAQAAAEAQRARLAALDATLDGRLTATYRRWQAAAEQLAATERDVMPATEQAAALSMQAYREGARDLASALVAARDLASARAELDAVRAAAALAFAELAVASGQDGDAR